MLRFFFGRGVRLPGKAGLNHVGVVEDVAEAVDARNPVSRPHVEVAVAPGGSDVVTVGSNAYPFARDGVYFFGGKGLDAPSAGSDFAVATGKAYEGGDFPA
jgi:hypothetical protein